MRGRGQLYRRWGGRCWWAAAALVVAALAPVAHCLWWGEVASEATVGLCQAAHPLGHFTALLVGGLGLLVVGLVLRIVAQQEDVAAQKDKKKRDRTIMEASRRQQMHTPHRNRKELAAGEAPVAIELDEELELSEEDSQESLELTPASEGDSMMVYLEDVHAAQKEREARTSQRGQSVDDQWYVPPGVEDAPVLFVDGAAEPAAIIDGSKRINNPNLAHHDLNDALEHAFRVVLDQGTPVVVRVMPGIYQKAVEIPDRVTLINHRMPSKMSVDERLKWLESQEDIDHPERVTLLCPAEASVAVRMRPGQQQGIFGIHLSGRPGIAQTGLVSHHNSALVVAHCGFENFSDSGAIVEESGEDLPGMGVNFLGCLWKGNSSSTGGGALRVQESAVRVEASVFDSNRAPCGGAIAVLGAGKPMVVERCLLRRNRALLEKAPTDVEAVKLERWHKIDGLGGAILVRRGLAKINHSNFEGNDAAVAGGAVAAAGARVVIKTPELGSGGCRGNRADIGGALFAVGWSSDAGLIRAVNLELRQNLGKSIGGACAALGNAAVQMEGCLVETNRAAGEERGFGGGLAVMRGASAKVLDTEIRENRALGGGGGVAAINGSVMISGETLVTKNRADGACGGGGVLVVTEEDRDLESWVGREGFSIPLKCRIEEVEIRANRAAGPGGGLRIGNRAKEATFPLAVVVSQPRLIRRNSSDVKDPLAENLWVYWAGSLRCNDERKKPVKMALK